MGNAPTRCIDCGGLTTALNEDEEGVPCQACAERLLETLPGVFHSPWGEEVERSDEDPSEGVPSDGVRADGEFEDAPGSNGDAAG